VSPRHTHNRSKTHTQEAHTRQRNTTKTSQKVFEERREGEGREGNSTLEELHLAHDPPRHLARQQEGGRGRGAGGLPLPLLAGAAFRAAFSGVALGAARPLLGLDFVLFFAREEVGVSDERARRRATAACDALR